MFKSLRELLLRKAMSEDMRVLVSAMDDESLGTRVLDVLEKMATYKRSAAQPNASLAHFIGEMKAEKEATGMEPTAAALVRDAMGHHASVYREAVGKGDIATADKHAQQFIKYGHLAHKVSREAPGLMDMDAPDLQPWQHGQEHFTDKSKTSGQNLTGWKSHYDSSKNRGDFSWLRGSPHPARAKEVFSKPHSNDEEGNPQYHDGPYPMEHTKINDKYITLHKDAKGSHPMDSHPIMKVFHHSDSKHGASEAARYHQDLATYLSSPHGEAAVNLLERAMDPEAGKAPGAGAHDLMPNKPRLARTVGERLSQQTEVPKEFEEANIHDFLSNLPDEEPDVHDLLSSLPDEEAPKARTKAEIHGDIKGLDPTSPDFLDKMTALTDELKRAKE